MSQSLQGMSVLLTRPLVQSQVTSRKLEKLGAIIFVVPLLEVKANVNSDMTFSQNGFNPNIIIFSSPNAVRIVVESAGAEQIQSFAGQIVVPGRGTAKELKKVGAKNIHYPQTTENSEGMLDLALLREVKGRRVVIFRGQSGRELLANSLRERGAEVRYVPVYSRQPCLEIDIDKIRNWLNQTNPILLLSSETALNTMCSVLPEMLRNRVWAQIVLVFGGRLKTLCQAKGWCGRIVVVDRPGDNGVAVALESL
jgi:uroporphyrinogen-III synthase